MELTKRQINRYIHIFEDYDCIKTLEDMKKRNVLWFLEENLQSKDYPYYLHTSNGYEDELGFFAYKDIVGIKTKEQAREVAIYYQRWASDSCLTCRQLYCYIEFFTQLGKRFGLLKEFRENGII